MILFYFMQLHLKFFSLSRSPLVWMGHLLLKHSLPNLNAETWRSLCFVKIPPRLKDASWLVSDWAHCVLSLHSATAPCFSAPSAAMDQWRPAFTGSCLHYVERTRISNYNWWRRLKLTFIEALKPRQIFLFRVRCFTIITAWPEYFVEHFPADFYYFFFLQQKCF